MKIRRTDIEVLSCGELVAKGFTVMQIESMTGVPHSTVHWIVLNRLPRIDETLYYKCVDVFRQHRHKQGFRHCE